VRPEAAALPRGHDADWKHDVPVELAGFDSGVTDGVTKCAAFWRPFVQNPNVMGWIDNGYNLL